MKEIYRRTVWVYGAQVGLSNASHPEGYPTSWDTDDQLFIASPDAIAVATAPNEDVEIVVMVGDGGVEDDLLISMPLRVGGAGLAVGTSDDVDRVDWPPGVFNLRVYVAGSRGRPARVTFVLSPIPGDE